MRALGKVRLPAWVLLLLLRVAAAGEGPTVESSDARLRAELGRLLAAAPASGTLGVHVVRATTGEPVFARDAETPCIPASTMKLVTSAAAVVELGRGYRFRTRLLARGPPGADGVLAGDLVVCGGGDPTLDAGEDLVALVRQLGARGVRRVTGDLVLDDGVFDRVLRHPDWPEDQLSRSYCAPVGGLLLNEGCLRVTVRPSSTVNGAAGVHLSPATSAVRVVNSITTTLRKQEHRIILDLDIAAGAIRGRGKVWIRSGGYATEVAMPDPTACFGDLLRREMARQEIALAGKVVRRTGEPPPEELARVETDLAKVVRGINRDSRNVYAECLLKTLGRECAGEGSFAAGSAVTGRLGERVGAPADQLHQSDGSGLARSNRVSPYFLTRVLGHLYRSEDARWFLQTLAAGGAEEGTLSRRLGDLGGEVRAKTGTIRGVSALAGYVRAKSGRILCFAVLVNRRGKSWLSKARALQDAVCRILFREG